MTKNAQQPLRQDIKHLGKALGIVLQEQVSQHFYQKVEKIRLLAKSARSNSPTAEQDFNKLHNLIKKQNNQELLLLARAFHQFLNLANIAETYHALRQQEDNVVEKTLQHLLTHKKTSKKKLYETVINLNIKLVLTAHPTEVKRRTLIQKLGYITDLLKKQHQIKLRPEEQQDIQESLLTLITSIWQTDEIRRTRPTPVEEARWGLAIIENTLWDAIPIYLRTLDQNLQKYTKQRLPIHLSPIRFGSWMGGDRDGNPNVTADITAEVCLLSRWIAMSLYEKELTTLIQHLSMRQCNRKLRQLVKDAREPYRVLLRNLRKKVRDTHSHLYALMQGKKPHSHNNILTDNNELIEPLMLCYDSLCSHQGERIANDKLLDLIRRVHCFGLSLTTLDIRQDASRHTRLLTHLTSHLKLGSYANWNEAEKLSFLNKAYKGYYNITTINRLKLDAQDKEVLDTFKVIANEASNSLGSYIISMANSASDVLAVIILQKSVGLKKLLPVVPLFETLADLKNCHHIMQTLFKIDWYRKITHHKQEVMIGYSDSAKDAGKLTATWAQYQAIEKLMLVAKKHKIQLSFFHGRGGSIGRGGGPVHAALMSQPPGSVNNTIRVTEQGEVIQQKFAFKELAHLNLDIYTSAMLEANIVPPIKPQPRWRTLLHDMSNCSNLVYNNTVKNNKKFVDYFHQATPAKELSRLYIGSRPAKRNQKSGIESLRAIPWVFAWTQNRLMLPAWLGLGEALHLAIAHHHQHELQNMISEWPFFNALMDMLDMVLVKSSARITQLYDDRLLHKDLQLIGNELISRLKNTLQANQKLIRHIIPNKTRQTYRTSVQLRNTYTDPLNLIQIEIMYRLYQTKHNRRERQLIEDTLLVTIAGIAAAMKNTG